MAAGGHVQSCGNTAAPLSATTRAILQHGASSFTRRGDRTFNIDSSTSILLVTTDNDVATWYGVTDVYPWFVRSLNSDKAILFISSTPLLIIREMRE
jgi:hypothetical protein